jgi:O-antigen/teichoic acid export membrane protein
VVPRFSAHQIKKLLHLSLPLGIVTMLISFNGNVPRYMISHFQGVRELGIFSALGYILTAGTMVVNALGQSATPRLALYAAHGKNRDFQSLSNRLLLIGLALGVCGVLAALVLGRQIITLIYGREYTQDHRLLLWLMVAATASYMAAFGGYSLTAARHFKIQTPLFGLVTIVTVVSCYSLVKADGAVGAAKALAVVGFLQLAATMAVLRYMEVRKSGDHL